MTNPGFKLISWHEETKALTPFSHPYFPQGSVAVCSMRPYSTWDGQGRLLGRGDHELDFDLTGQHHRDLLLSLGCW